MRKNEHFQRTCWSSILGLSYLHTYLTAHAAELLVIEEPNCVYCARFNHEIAPICDKTSEARIAPLRRFQFRDPFPVEFSNIRAVEVTPTFILVDDGQEVDRLVGYPADEYFWFLLSEMMKKII